ncbi:MAG TPA: V-type ATP synthase subunit E [Gemmatimonadales bacterium]|nr:V-type ATP synthase subunit E [Gemmatimonadales bacterium]
MGLEHLLEALERDANAQIEQLLAQARAEADRLTAAGSEALQRRRDNAHALGERSRDQEVAHAVALARRGARRSVLEARERLLERVFVAARSALPGAAAGAAYRAALPAALAGALAAIGNEPAVIRCTQALVADVDRLRPVDRASVVVDPANGSGFRLTTVDGMVEVDDTLEARLERQRPILARLVLGQLELEA